MKYKTLNAKHKCYDPCLYEDYNALYEGGKTFEKHKEHFLEKNEFEPPQIFKSRKANAEYQNFVGPIIDQLASQLFSSPFKIDTESKAKLDPFYADFQNDADGGGKDLINFYQDRFIKGVTTGAGWYVLEMPQLTPEMQQLKSDKKLSMEQADQLGARRVTLCAVDNSQVFNWAVNEYGDFIWVCIYKKECQVLNPFTDPSDVITETWKFYDSSEIITFVKSHKEGEVVDDETEIAVKSKIKHGFSKIPVRKLQFPLGLWIMNRVASAQIGHFRSSAQLDWAQRNCAYPMPVFKSVDATKPPVMGAGRFILIDPEEDFGYAAPGSDSFVSLADRIESKRVEIYRVTQQMAAGISNSAVIGRSADSKAIDVGATDICLRAYGRFIKEEVETTLDLIKDARLESDIDFTVEGMAQFSQEELSEAIKNLTAAKAMVTHSPSYLENIEHTIIDLSFPNIDAAEKQEMHDEVESAYEALEASLAPGDSINVPMDDESKTSNDVK